MTMMFRHPPLAWETCQQTVVKAWSAVIHPMGMRRWGTVNRRGWPEREQLVMFDAYLEVIGGSQNVVIQGSSFRLEIKPNRN